MRSIITRITRRYPVADRIARTLLAAAPRRGRMGPTFFHWYALNLEAEQWDPAKVAAFRHELLVDLLRDVARDNPFYTAILAGKSPESVADNLAAHIPEMTRDLFRASYADLKSRGETGPLSFGSTSGTSGNALQFAHTVDDNAREWAAICHQWRRVGYDPLRDKRAELRGLVTTRGIVQHFPELMMVRFSVLHLQAAHIRRYAEVCARDGIGFLHGYPSAIYVMAQEMLASGIRMPGIRGIMLASEMVYPAQTAAIEAAFPGAKIIAHYGNAERVALGAWCEHRRDYHFLPLYSQVEVAPDGAIVGTNLFNRVNPFIRYRMSDIVSNARDATCDACGRLALPLVGDVDGRAEDYLYSPDRGWIPPAIVTYPLKSLRAIHEIQFFQSDPNEIELRYTLRAGADSAAELDEVLSGLADLLGRPMVRAVRHDTLDRGPSGKMKWIVSCLSPDDVTHDRP